VSREPRAPPARRFLIAVGCAEPGENSRLRTLPGVRSDLARMHDLFVKRLGFNAVALGAASAQLNLDLSAHEIERGLQAFQRAEAPSGTDAIVFYFTGHGVNHGAAHYLCTRDFDAERPSTGLETRRLAAILPTSAQRLWLILDVCRAGDGAASLCEAIARDRGSYKGSVWFLAACGQTTALDQAFSQAFSASAERFVARGGCHAQAELVRSVQKRLGGERAAQRLVPSFYGSASFDFFGEPSRASTIVHGLVRPLGPSLQRLGLPGLAGDVSLPPAPARDLFPLDKGRERASGQPAARAARSRAFTLGALVTTIGLLLGTYVAWPRSAAVTSRGQPEGARALTASTGAGQDRLLFSGGITAPIPTREELRAAHARCVALGSCSGAFAASPFPDELDAPRQAVQTFALSRFEVTSLQFVHFLRARAAELTRVPTGPGQIALHDRAGRVWALVGSDAQHDLPLAIDAQGELALSDVQRGQEPITYVTWFGASAFCAARGGRLPSEAEWALAARGQGRTFPWGDEEPSGCQSASYGRHTAHECGALGEHPSAVGSAGQDVTPEGVHDLGGNVSEWTSSEFATPDSTRLHSGCTGAQKAAGSCRVVRGGSYWDSRFFLRASTRSALDASAFWRAVGFRCAFAASR
jgi:formylglycine-generating enzyme required for sulfatase activity